MLGVYWGSKSRKMMTLGRPTLLAPAIDLGWADISLRIHQRRPFGLWTSGEVAIDDGDLHDAVVIVGVQPGGLQIHDGEARRKRLGT